MALTVKSTSLNSPGTAELTEKIPALVSIHDVMPSTLARVDRIIDTLAHHNIHTATLLIVPGKPWQASQIDQLRRYSRQGFELAGHGWHHEVDTFGGFGHRLHGLFMSKKVAEHLALDTLGITDLMMRCHAWFGEHDLPAPDLYVPPAWAMGRIANSQLKQLPFRYYEFFSGIYDSEADRFETLPLVGYEADARWRAPFVALWNRLNFNRAKHNRLLRFSIHPDDFELYLRQNLVRDLQRVAPAFL